MTTGTLPNLATLSLRGFNLAGGEFGAQPGTHLQDYFYPHEDLRNWNTDVKYTTAEDLIDSGWTCFRVPISGRRILRSRDGELHEPDMQLIDDVVEQITGRGGYCMLDLHDYGGVGAQRPMVDGGDCVGTAQSGGSDTIVLGSGGNQSSNIPGWMDGLTIDLDGGTGSGQSRTITAYTGSGTDVTGTKLECTVDSPWSTIPDATTGYTITNGGCLNADLAYLWNKLSTRYKDNLNVIFDIMNEPSGGVTAATWWSAQQAAVTEIRTVVGATNAISVEGIAFSAAQSWLSQNTEALAFSDPDNNTFFQAHIYFDANNDGVTANPQDVAAILPRIDVFTQWLKTNSKIGFIGEFGPGKTLVSRNATRVFLAHLEANSDVYCGWTAWGMGSAWPANYHFFLDPLLHTMLHEYTPFVNEYGT